MLLLLMALASAQTDAECDAQYREHRDLHKLMYCIDPPITDPVALKRLAVCTAMREAAKKAGGDVTSAEIFVDGVSVSCSYH